MRSIIQLIGKSIGIISGVSACAAWMVEMWSPTPALHLSGFGFAVALMMAALAGVAVLAAYHGHGITLIVLFFASFFPIGLFLIGEAGGLGVIGFLNMGYLISGLAAWLVPKVVVPEN